MLLQFFDCLKQNNVPVSITELLDLLSALEKRVVFADTEQFYYLARCCLVKDEKNFDKYDRAYTAFFNGLESMEGLVEAFIPEDWLQAEFLKQLSDEDKEKAKSLGGLKELIEEFKKRLEEQQKKHQGGSKWIGTGGTSPFGHSGYNPEGIRVGGTGGGKKAAKVWEKRQYKNLDADQTISARNIQMALRRLRKFARTGAEDHLDIDDTINCTAKNAGLLDIKMVPERKNSVKVLMFFDVGGSMDYHVKTAQELFNAVRTEFKHLQYYFFHNFIYDSVWTDDKLRYNERIPVYEIVNRFSRDYKVIFVGDAAMSPYEVVQPGGAIDHWNEESGATAMERVLRAYEKVAWLNPEPQDSWQYTQSTIMIKDMFEQNMFPLTIDGLEDSMNFLVK